MNLIAAVDQNWAIGKDNGLLVKNPADMKFFREKTTGCVVVMGRKTLESFPGGLPLKNRVNVVLTANRGYSAKGAVIVHSREGLFEKLKEYGGEEIFVIGGESVYRMLLDECDTAYITKMDAKFEADAFFPNLDEQEGWEIASDSGEKRHGDLKFRFLTYQNRRVSSEIAE